MEDNELQKIWKTIDSDINQKSKVELGLVLTKKIKQTVNKFLFIMSFSIIICIGLLIYLIITSLNRQDDFIYVINNVTLGVLTLISLTSVLLSWYKIQNNRYNQSLKSWLEERIYLLSKGLTGRFSKLHIYLIPFLYILIVLSIHVYFEHKPFFEVFKTEESVIGLIVGTPIGLFVAYFLARKVRKFQMQNLEYLKELYNQQ